MGEEYVASGANLEVVLPVGGSLIVEGWTNKDAGITLRPATDDPSNFLSPLVLDLDGDGLELIDLAASGAFFDIDLQPAAPARRAAQVGSLSPAPPNVRARLWRASSQAPAAKSARAAKPGASWSRTSPRRALTARYCAPP